MPRSLRLWNGRWGRNNEQHIYIAAYSQKDAVNVIEELFGDRPRLTLYELQKYFSPHWGNPMDGIKPERGAWITHSWRETPQRIHKQ